MSGSIITVTNTNDSGAGSLRQAILDAGTDPDVCINFDEDLKGQTITLQNYLLIDSGQDIMITGDVDGDGEIDITISGDANGNGVRDFGDTRFMKVESGATAHLDYLALIESYTRNSFDAADSNISDAAANITNYGDMTISNSLIADNVAQSDDYLPVRKIRAATVYTAVESLTDPRSSLTVTDTLFEDNKAYGGDAFYGGGQNPVAPEAVAGILQVYSDLTITRTGFGGTAEGGLTYGAKNGSNAVVGVRKYGGGDLTGPDGLIQIGIQPGSTATPGAPQGTGSAASGTIGVLGAPASGNTLVTGEAGTSGNDTLSGGGEGTAKLILAFGDNDVISSGNENDTIFGGAGDDFIAIGSIAASNTNAVRAYGDAGNDRIGVYDANGVHTFSGGRGVDTLNFLLAGDASAGITVNLSTTSAQQVDANLTATITGIENLIGTGNNDLLTGDGQANNIDGVFGKDTIDGGGGDDTIAGAYGGTQGDEIILSGGAGADVLLVQGGETLARGAGGEGSLDEDFDTISFAKFQSGVDDPTQAFGVNFSLQLDGQRQIFRSDGSEGGGAVTIEQIEGVIGSGQDDTLTAATFEANRLDGGDGGDVLNAASAGDTLSGGGGNDTLNGTGARDLLQGGADNDSLVGGGNADTMQGGGGVDRLIGGGGADEMLGGAQNDRMFGGNGVDDMRGGGGGDVMKGGGGGDEMRGDGGSDNLAGEGGKDRLIGGGGGDTISGGGDNDTIVGGGGSDRMTGGAGADRLSAGAGADTLTGGGGADQFIFAPRQGVNLVRDFQNGVDKIKISGVSNFGQLNISEAQGDAIIRFKQTTIRLDGVDSDLVDRSDFIFGRSGAEKPAAPNAGPDPAPDDDPLIAFLGMGADDLL